MYTELYFSKKKGFMKALVYHGPGKISSHEKPKPTRRDATDATVKVAKTTICDADLGMVKGEAPSTETGEEVFMDEPTLILTREIFST